MCTRPAVVALRDALSSLSSTQPIAAAGLGSEVMRAHVYTVVDDMREDGWPVERVIIALKTIAENAGLRPTRVVLVASAPLTETDAIIASLVRWTLDQFYPAGTH